MKCEGIPNGPCPDNADDDEVFFNYAELWLCKKCENTRRQINRLPPNNTSTHVNTTLNSDNNRPRSMNTRNPLIQPLLAYCAFSMQSGTHENIKRAIVGHFSIEQIVRAKTDLWEYVGDSIIGKYEHRKDSSRRSESVAHIEDFVMHCKNWTLPKRCQTL